MGLPTRPTARAKRRERLSLLISINIHLWVLVAVAAHWAMADTPEPEPEFLQVQRIELPPPPAPVEGQTAELQPAEPARVQERPVARRVKKSTPEQSEAQVRWSFSVAAPESLNPDSKLRFIASTDSDLQHCLEQAAEQRRQARPSSANAHPRDPAPEDLPFFAHDGAEAPENLPPVVEPGGNTLALIDIIQRRIDAVSPLVLRTSSDCRAFGGQARVRFLMNAQGYPIGYQVLDSSGSLCLDREIDTVLHLAEPYPRVAGWVPVRVTFRHRGS